MLGIIDTYKRSIAKTITFRILAIIVTMFLVYFWTGDLKIAGIVGVLDSIMKIIIYFLHERIWARFCWGKKIVTRF
ncbi:MAG: DUF2061 domain-containing protein [Candidatus Buchananbacteria bacterium]|nr:DUF2061 domain-containing protein [Candidatus Buchananbacteria bacterium]